MYRKDLYTEKTILTRIVDHSYTDPLTIHKQVTGHQTLVWWSNACISGRIRFTSLILLALIAPVETLALRVLHGQQMRLTRLLFLSRLSPSSSWRVNSSILSRSPEDLPSANWRDLSAASCAAIAAAASSSFIFSLLFETCSAALVFSSSCCRMSV